MKWLIAVLVLLLAMPVSVSAATLIYSDFESGNVDAGLWVIHAEGGVSDTTTTNTYAGTYSARFTLTSDRRAEIQIVPPSSVGYDWGTEYWVGFAVNVTQDIDYWGVFLQHHATPNDLDWGCTAGPNGISMFQDGTDLVISGSTNASLVNTTPGHGGADWGHVELYSTTIQIDHWYEVVMHFKYATDATGFWEIWIDGTKVVDWSGVTTYNRDLCGLTRYPVNYQKLGTYANSGSDGQVLYDNFRAADSDSTYADVHPDGDAPPGGSKYCYLDFDGDDYSDGTSEFVSSCSENYYEAGDLIATTGDCNDSDAAINPGATEICDNGVDDNCSGADSECLISTVGTGNCVVGSGIMVIQ